jgi:hypothetical protein
MLHDDALRWLNTLRLNDRLKLKHIPISITHELVELGFARIRGGNLVITTAGMNGSPIRRAYGGPAQSQPSSSLI